MNVFFIRCVVIKYMVVLYVADPNSIHDRRWIEAFCRKGIKCIVVPRWNHFHTWQNNHLKNEVSFNVEQPLPDPSVLHPLREAKGALHIRKLIKKYKVIILHIIYAEPNALWCRFKYIFKIPIFITTHGSDILKTIPSFDQRKGILNRIVYERYKTSFTYADQITCSSTSQRNSLLQISADLKPKINVIRVGVDLGCVYQSNFSPLVDGSPFILMPRNMQPIYNHEFTLDAIKLLDEKYKREYSFVFLNSDTKNIEYFNKVKNKANSIDTKFIFFPTLEHKALIGLYKQASLVIMNPLSDGTPVSAMEAMACKVPVILGPVKYDSEIFNDSVFKVERWNPMDLALLITNLLANRDDLIGKTVDNAFHAVSVYGNFELEICKVINLYYKYVD